MKKLILCTIAAAFTMNVNAQVINDSVLIGGSPNYANQVWYSLENDEKATAPKTDWDLAFDVKSITSSIHINAVTGTTLWCYPKADISGWGGTIDTNGLSTWASRNNSDTSWTYGAMGNYADPNDPTDLDWGKYNMTTHKVSGDSIFIIKLSNGDYKKLAIEGLSGGTFTFKYANIDGSNPQTGSIVKGNFANKNFAYYSLQNNAALAATREPDADAWDLLFTQYQAYIPTPYNVTGILLNRGVHAAKASNLPNKTTYADWGAHTFASPVNTIGYNWKSFNGTAYVIKDSTVYFVKAIDGSIWKMIFTGFTSSSGAMAFSKEKLLTENVKDAAGALSISASLYPNPANGQQPVTVVYDFEANYTNTSLGVMDISGRIVYTSALETSTGIHQHTVPTEKLSPGIYIVTIQADEQRAQQKLIVR